MERQKEETIDCCYMTFLLHVAAYNGHLQGGWLAKARVKGKAIPLQAWTGPEGSRSLRLPDFKTVGT